MIWTKKPIGLSYRVGFKQLARVRVNGIVCQAHISALSSRHAEAAPIEAMRERRVNAAHFPSCPTAGALPVLRWTSGCFRYVIATFPHYITEIRGSFEDYAIRTFSSRRRKKFRRLKRRWQAHCGHDIEIREYRSESEIETFLPLAEQVSVRTRIHRHMGRGVEVDNVYGRRIRDAASEGVARGYLLFCRGEPVAYDYAELDSDGVLRVELVGYAPEYGQWEVGTLLNLGLVERIHGDPRVKVLDYCEGEAQYKARFATRRYDAAEIVFFRPTPRNLAVFGSHLLLTQSYMLTRSLLLKTGTMDIARRLATRAS